MELSEALKKRRSIRKFIDIPVEYTKILEILEAGRTAPSAGNLQPVKFLVVANNDTIKKIADACLQQLWIETAPVVIIVCVDYSRVKQHYGERGEELYSIQDGAAAIENMLLMAEEKELATCWVGAFSEEMLKRALNIPDGIRPQAVLPIGYADEKPITPPKLELRDITFFETYANKVRMTSLWPLEKHAGKLAGALDVYNQKVGKALAKVKKKP